jgi:Aerotolerance regulator N-terminal/von Willebrand factor type A domain
MTLLAPLALTGLILLPVLVVFYLFRPEPRQQQSTTYFLWREAAPDSQGGTFARRLQSNPLLWLQLLVLLLLVLFLARPSTPWLSQAPQASRVILVLDRSASMKAGDSFDKAKREVEEAIESLLGFRLSGTTPEVMLIAVDSEPRVLVPFTKDSSLLKNTLGQLEPSEAPDNLEGLRPFLASMIKSHRAKIWFFGDRLPEALRLGGVQFTSVAQEESNNVGILSFSVQNPDTSRGQKKPFLYARLENFSGTAQQRIVRLEKLHRGKPEQVEALIFERSILLAAESGQTVIEPIGAFRFKTDQSSLFRLTLTSPSGSQSDIFGSDDVAFSVVAPFSTNHVLVATSGVEASFLLRAIAASSGIKVVKVGQLLAQPDPPTVDLLLAPAGSGLPRDLKVRSRFLLAPKPASEKRLSSKLRLADQKAPIVSDSGVEWTRLKVELTDKTPLQSDEVALLETAEGPALSLSGAAQGLPTLHWRFPIAYSSLPLSPALPVVVGRFIDLYSRSSGIPVDGSVPTVEPFLRPTGTLWGGELTLDPLAGTASEAASQQTISEHSPTVRAPEYTGLYSLKSQQMKSGEVLAVNLFSSSESKLPRDLGDMAFAEDESFEATPEDQSEQVQFRSIGVPFLALALLLLLIEAAVFLRRGRP